MKPLPKISRIIVKKGDILVYRTAGGGGWKDPFDRPSEKVFKDVRNGLVSIEKAKSDYGGLRIRIGKFWQRRNCGGYFK